MTILERSTTSVRRRTVLALTISSIGLAGGAMADTAADPVDLQVVDRETGQPLQVWRRDDRWFVAGQPGARYSLRVANHTGGRVLAVMSVDGVNIITGQTAGYGQRGYVLGPYQSYDVSGWRKSDTEVAAFTFAPLPQSYAARTGRPLDIGVIGIAAFKERVAAPPQPVAQAAPAARGDSDHSISEIVVTGTRVPSPNLSAPAPVAEQQAEKLGTGHGAREWSVSTRVAFERATAYPQFIRRIEYDTRENLIALRVIRPPVDIGRRPRAFPAGDAGPYAPDPPAWP